jgi:putative salt-induced outer membrane protein
MKNARLLCCLAALMATGLSALAQSAPTAPKDTGWVSTAALGVTISKGNTDNELFTGNILTSRKWDANELDLGVDGQYGETSGEMTSGNIRGFGQFNRLFDERLFGLLRVEAMNDAIADIDYRLTVSPGLGYYLIKSTNQFLRVEAGPGFIWEQLGGEEDSYITLRLAERYERTLNANVKLWQSLEYLPEISDFGNYILNAEIGIDSALTKKISLRLYVQDTFDSEPAPGRDKNDVKIVAQLAYKFQ